MTDLVTRNKFTHTDGREEEYARVLTYNLKSPKEVEQLGREILQVAAEWQSEIEARGAPGPPPKTFEFITHFGGGRQTVASWVDHPWALVRYGGATSIAFLTEKENNRFRGWIVSTKFANGKYQWKCRYECSSAIETRDLLLTFPYTLPRSPTLGDVEWARKTARAANVGTAA